MNTNKIKIGPLCVEADRIRIVATLMGGGVGLVYATHAIEVVDQLLDQPR